jgi:small GTP-binding protein
MTLKICMVGSFGVGKTSLVRRFVFSEYDEKYHTTVGVKVDKKIVRVGQEDVTLMLWDMAGEEEGLPIRMNHLRGAAGYLLVADGTRAKTMDVALDIHARIGREIGLAPHIFLVNKVDQRQQWEIADPALDELRERGWIISATSAKTGEHVEEAFANLATRILQDKHGVAGL